MGRLTMKRSYIWSVPTRLFHWLLAFSILTGYLTGDEERLLNLHVAFGAMAGALLLFRILWGIAGVRYSAFKDFELTPSALLSYMVNIFNPRRHYAGHNPAASWAVILMIVLGLLAVVTGFLAYGVQEGRGILGFLNHGFFREMELFEALHEVSANLLMLVIAAHVGGVVLERLLHKEVGTMGSMANGYKHIEAESVRLNIFQKLLATVGLGAAVALFIYAVSVPGNSLIASTNAPVDYKQEHTAFYDECIACHTLYPPFLLPKVSWRVMMEDLENHFGDDASLDEPVRVSILAYLEKHAAENSTKEAAFKGMRGAEEGNTTLIAYTDTPYWKARHREIDPARFKSKAVKSRANCKACHLNIEKGIIEDEYIRMPEMEKVR